MNFTAILIDWELKFYYSDRNKLPQQLKAGQGNISDECNRFPC